MKFYSCFISAVILLLFVLPQQTNSQPFFESLPGPTGGKTYAVGCSETGDAVCLTRSRIFRWGTSAQEWEHVYSFPRDVNTKELYRAPNGTMYACTVTGRLHRSTDAGLSWAKVEGVNGLSKEIVATADGTLFHVGDGVQMSTDEGSTWVDRSTGIEDASIHALTDLGGGTLLVGVWNQGLFRTGNSGASWQAVEGSPTTVYELFVTSSGKIWASTSGQAYFSTDQGTTWQPSAEFTSRTMMGYCETPSGNLFTCSSWATDGIYRSTDDGVSWTKVLKDYGYRESNGLCCTDAGVLFCAGGDGVVMSTDDGDSWTVVNHGLTVASIEDVVENNSGMLFAAVHRGNVYRSTDNGQRWEDVTAPGGMDRILYLKRDENDAIIAAGNTVVYRSTDDGMNWEDLNPNDRFSSAKDLLVLPPDVLIVADKGKVFYSSDNGTQWESRSNGLPDAYISTLLQLPGDVLLGAVDQNGMYRSSDEGQTWQKYGDFPDNNWVHDIARKEPQTLYAVTSRNGVYRSLDDGLHWDTYNSGVHSTTVYSIHVTSSGDVVCGASNGTLLLVEEADTWVKLEGIEGHVDAFYTDSRDYLLAGTDGDGLFSSRTALTAPVPATPVLLSPGNSATETGTSPSFSWNAVNTALYYQLQIAEGQSMADPVIDSVFASRETLGVRGLTEPQQYYWRLRAANISGSGPWSEVRTFHTGTVAGADDAPAVASTALLSSYPNPARTQVEISFFLASSGQAEVALYSLLGKRVVTTESVHRTTGEHNVTLDVSALPAGIYLCRLSTEDSIVTQRMTVLR